jgi:hypothetical protein
MAAPNECIPIKSPALTFAALVESGGSVTGKCFVKVSQPRSGGGLNGLSTDVHNLPIVEICDTAGEAAIGVAANDAASGAVVSVFKIGNGIVLPITAGANITAGQEVQCDANGQAIPYAPPTTTTATPLPTVRVLGYALDSASSGQDCEICLL